MMAKAPAPGRVKTRLSPPFSDEQCAAWASAFAQDTWSALAKVPDARHLLAWAGEAEKLPSGLRSADRFSQVGADLGRRMTHAAQRCLANGGTSVLVGSDLPGLPPQHVVDALDALRSCDAVIGGSSDGGYYLIGFARVEEDLLDDLPWSAANTRAATEERLRDRGYRVAYVPMFDDIDELSDLRRALTSGAEMHCTQTLARTLGHLL